MQNSCLKDKCMQLNYDARKIVYLRSTSIFNDSRAVKEIDALLENNYKLLVFGWDRDGFGKIKLSTSQKRDVLKIFYFKIKSNYGDGLKSIAKLLLFQIWQLFMMLKNISLFEIIHCCDFETALPAFIISKIFKKKVVYDSYDYYIHSRPVPSFIRFIIEKLEVLVINNSSVLLICNESRYEQVKKSNPKNIVVIHNTPDIDYDKYLSKNLNTKFKIVYVGLLQDGRLLNEIGDLIPIYKNIELHIGGYGNLDHYFLKLSKDHDNVFFYGQMDYDNVLTLESQSNILFATYDPKILNHKYSAPNKLYEAMALSKPIIVSKGTGIDAIVDREKIGISIDYNVESFFEAAQYLANSPTICCNMGNNARKLYKSEYNWRIMKKRLIDAYDSIK